MNSLEHVLNVFSDNLSQSVKMAPQGCMETLSPQSIALYKKDAQIFLRHLAENGIDHVDVNALATFLEGYSPGTQRRFQASLSSRGLLELLPESGVRVSVSPEEFRTLVGKTPRTRERERLTEDEVYTLAQHVQNLERMGSKEYSDYASIRDSLLVKLIYFSEKSFFTIAQSTESRMSIQTINGPGVYIGHKHPTYATCLGRPEDVEVLAFKDILSRFKRSLRITEDVSFISSNGQPYALNSLAKNLRKCAESSGIVATPLALKIGRVVSNKS